MTLSDSQNLHWSSESCDNIVALLTHRQHVRPHLSVLEVMRQSTEELGCCPQAIARAMDWLKIDASRPIGRLRRSELLQLARAVDRFWHESVTTTGA